MRIIGECPASKACESRQAISEPFNQTKDRSRGSMLDGHEAGEQGGRDFVTDINKKAC